VPGQQVDHRKLGERLWKKNREDVMDHNRWRKEKGVIDDYYNDPI